MEKLKEKANIIYCGLFIYLVATAFVNQDVYAFTVRFASLIIFAVLFVLSLPYLGDDIRNKDADLILTVLSVIFSVVFVFVTGSGYGAALIPSHLALICYMQKHTRLGFRDITAISFAGAVPVILWYSHVRWSYNFNMAGFAFMIMAFFAMILTEYAGKVTESRRGKPEAGESAEVESDGAIGADKGKSRRKLSADCVLAEWRGYFELIIFITAFILSMLYHSRTVMFGMVMFVVSYLALRVMLTRTGGAYILREPRRTGGGRVVFNILFLAASAGAVLFTGLYVLLSDRLGNITLLYKDIFSGRQGIWRELWGAFEQSPLTGIGSAYELKSFEIFEVHNGMFDILAVHGIIVFMLVLVLLWRMFGRVYISLCGVEGADMHGLHKETDASGGAVADDVSRADAGRGALQHASVIALSAAFAMMFTSYFENFFTVPPYSFIFLTFILIACGPADRGK